MHFPNESPEYRAARDRLLEKEIELRRQMEAVAEERRKLPPGGMLKEDYVFDGLGADGKPARIRFSELFAPGRDTLIAYDMMFPRYPSDPRPKPADGAFAKLPREDSPCPSCTALVDQWDGAAAHLEAAGFNFVVIAKTPLERLLTFAGERGWRHVRFLSAAGNSFKRDYHGGTRKAISSRCCTCSTARRTASATSGARNCISPRPSPARTSAPSARWSRSGILST